MHVDCAPIHQRRALAVQLRSSAAVPASVALLAVLAATLLLCWQMQWRQQHLQQAAHQHTCSQGAPVFQAALGGA
uniref:Uncharacterized protein n=1 Tax=Tetradesmus obliquus TaxID=3088 RepID=A0A383WNE3_TETOB